MGAPGLEPPVADAGPLIHLTEIGRLDLLQSFTTLYIPDAVRLETVGQMRVSDADLVKLSIVQRHHLDPATVQHFIQKSMLTRLQIGECECLYLCQPSGISTLLTDDLAVREAAKHFGLTPVGSLGVVVRAFHLRRISLSDAEAFLTALYEKSSLFVTKALVELAIERLRLERV